MEILGFVNMNKTERITYAFNMRAPGGRYNSLNIYIEAHLWENFKYSICKQQRCGLCILSVASL